MLLVLIIAMGMTLPKLKFQPETAAEAEESIRRTLIASLTGIDSPQRLVFFFNDEGGREMLMSEGKKVSEKPFLKVENGLNHSVNPEKIFQELDSIWQRKSKVAIDVAFMFSKIARDRLSPLDPGHETFTIEDLLKRKEIIQSLVAEKELLIMTGNPDIQRTLEALKLVAKLPSFAPDEKTDRLLINGPVKNATLHTALDPDGTLRNWLQLEAEKGLTKILVPAGSELLRSSEALTSHALPYYTAWVVDKGTVTTDLEYRLPFRLQTVSVDTYRLQLVKAPFTTAVPFSHVLKLPPGLTVLQRSKSVKEIDRDVTIEVVVGRNP